MGICPPLRVEKWSSALDKDVNSGMNVTPPEGRRRSERWEENNRPSHQARDSQSHRPRKGWGGRGKQKRRTPTCVGFTMTHQAQHKQHHV